MKLTFNKEEVKKAEHTERDDLSCHGSTDISTVDDSRCLRERHYSCINKAYNHDCRGSGALNRGSSDRAYSYAEHLAAGSFGEERFQLAAAERFEVRTHHGAGNKKYTDARREL